MLITLYGQLVPQPGYCRGFCLTNPVVQVFSIWYIWIPIGLILAALGGFVGVVLCFVTLGEWKG